MPAPKTHVHKEVLDEKQEFLICSECKFIIMSVTTFKELQETNRRFQASEIDAETYAQTMKELKEQADKESCHMSLDSLEAKTSEGI